MSVSKWAYLPERCDGNPCPGDCDVCAMADENMVIRYNVPEVNKVNKCPLCESKDIEKHGTEQGGLPWWLCMKCGCQWYQREDGDVDV